MMEHKYMYKNLVVYFFHFHRRQTLIQMMRWSSLMIAQNMMRIGMVVKDR